MRLKAYITALHAALFAILLAVSPAGSGSMMLLGAGKATAGGGGSPAYLFRAAVFTTSASANAVTISIDIGTASADRVVALGAINIGAQVITSVVVDPTGANVSLTKNTQQDSGTGAGVTSAIWSGLVVSGSGTKNIVITYATDPNFQNMGYHVWTLTGLGSNAPRTSGSGFGSTTIGVTAGHILLAVSNKTAVPWASSTETAAGSRVDSNPISSSEDWTIVSTNASFSLSPPNFIWSAATFF